MAPRDNSADLFTPAPLPVAPLDDAQRLACLRLIRSENVGPVTFRELINHYGGARQALEALPELARRAGRRKPIVICPADRAEAELAAAARHGARPLFTIEPGYPPALAHLAAPPPMLYVKGRPELLKNDALAIVGSRNASAAGIAMTRLLASRVGAAGFMIASGLARGIDAAAHDASLATGTIAVLAGGIDFVYPPENAELHDRIAENGCLVTEMPPGFQPRGQDFPRRNRIVSGLSLAVLVIEAVRRSGSLITAHAANEQGRVVMAVPGHPLDPRSEGPNGLLRKPGVTMVTSANDVLEVLEPMRRQVSSAGPRLSETNLGATWNADAPELADARVPDGPETPVTIRSAPDDDVAGSADADARVLSALGAAPATIDDIARATGLSARAVKIALMELSLAGRVEQHGNQLVSLRVS